MRLTFFFEHRFLRTDDGAVWTANQYPREFWDRYLAVFDKVEVVARVRNVERRDPMWKRVDGPRVGVTCVPDYQGPRQFALRIRSVRKAVRRAVDDADAVILRGPGTLSAMAAGRLRQTRRQFGVEVVGDPRDVFSADGVNHPLRVFFRWMFARELTRQCNAAVACLYVTARTLQTRYPCSGAIFSASNVELSASDILRPRLAPARARTSTAVGAAPPRDNRDFHLAEACGEGVHSRRPVALIGIGAMEQMYKGFDLLIHALRELVDAGDNVTLSLVGEGKYRGVLEELALSLGVKDRTMFVGQVPSGTPIFNLLDAADIFVLPSRTEGLPRAMIEAMARGLPCVGTDVGGIPELLPPEALVPAGRVDALVAIIRRIIHQPALYEHLAEQNTKRARLYQTESLQQQREAFYRTIKAVS